MAQENTTVPAAQFSDPPEAPQGESRCAAFHFTPAQGWLNDPNGLVYYQGEFHLFYQYYPQDIVWGPMHWGHAVSSDLVHWQHLPVALFPDQLGYIYSGSAVIDWHNSAGFGPQAMVAIFTHHNPDNHSESQSIAYSLDKGRTWTKFGGNPVIPAPAGQRTDFRDPKVFWYGSAEEEGHWVMLLAAKDRILFFTSADLISWEPSGRFVAEEDSRAGVWETPDLFLLPVNGGPESRWVLTAGLIDGAPAGGSGTHYFVGHFDGRSFTCESPRPQARWADWGADFYAAQSWNGLGRQPGGRRIWLAWCNNWRYARRIPTCGTRGMMTLPRELGLLSTAEGLRLIQEPVAELQTLRRQSAVYQDKKISPAMPFVPAEGGDLLEIMAEFQLDAPSELTQFGLRLRTGEEEATTVGYMAQEQRLFIDRTRAGLADFSADYPGRHEAAMAPMDDLVRLHLFLDRHSIELFANNGLVVMSDLIFPTQLPYQVELFAVGGTLLVKRLELHLLDSANEQMRR